MNTTNPMDGQFDQFDAVEREMNVRREMLDFGDTANASEYLSAIHQTQTAVRALDLAMRSRNGLVKKLFTEFK